MASDGAGDEAGEAEPRRGHRLRPWLGLVVRVSLVGALLTWFLFSADLPAFGRAFARVAWVAFVPALLGHALVNVVGGLRWWVLMSAFGASDLPRPLTAIRLFYTGLFYNTFVPGSFGGDVVRGVVTQKHFANRAASYMVILLERTVGFSAMILVFFLGLVVGPEVLDLRAQTPWLVAVLALGLVVVTAALISGRVSPQLRKLPQISRPLNLLWVFLLSLVSHFLGITVMYSLVLGMGLPLSYGALVLVMPVAFTAAVVPLNVLGVGTREVTLVALLPRLGPSTEEVVALSLCYAAVHLGISAVGGLLELFVRRSVPER